MEAHVSEYQTIEVEGAEGGLPSTITGPIRVGHRFFRTCKDGSGVSRVTAKEDGVLLRTNGSVVFVPLSALEHVLGIGK